MPGYQLKKKLYESLPATIKGLVRAVPFAWVAGRGYRRAVRRGQLLDRASRDVLHRYQEKALGEMLTFASDQVPAYQSLASIVGRLSPFEALRAFPLLDKEALQQNQSMYLPRDFDRIPHYACTTGGTSGNQLKFFVDDDSQAVETGFMHRQWARVGYHPGQRKATFRGVEFAALPHGVYWQTNPIYNELQFSPFQMNEGTLPAYLDALVRFRPGYLHGYPSAIAILAEYCNRHAVPADRLRLHAVLLGSESLYPDQRELIERAFGTRAYSWYGHSERVILAGECEQSPTYHHFPDYGVLEVVDDDGREVPVGESGELVGTGLLNRSLPLIRYRTGDRARRLDPICPCGRSFDRFDAVEGRWSQEFLLGRNGSKISLAALNMHGDFFDHVVRYQYYQDTPGAMEVRVMPAPGFSPDEAGQIQRAYANKTLDELAVTVTVVDDIPLTARGKLRRLIQAIPASTDPVT